MNTRQAIQPSSTPNVLSVSHSPSRHRFAAGLSTGLRICRADNCLPTYNPSTLHPDSPFSGSIAIAEALDDRYVAFVGGATAGKWKQSCVIFWDCIREQEVQRLDLSEPVRGIRVDGKWLVVVLESRSVIFGYQELQQPTPPPEIPDDGDENIHSGMYREQDKKLYGPNKVHALHSTSPNPFALAVLRDDLLVLPAQSVGQIQLIPLPSGSKRVLRAHNTALRCLAISPSGNLLASASQQGTLIRVFNTKTLDQIAEFRRGVDKAIVYGLAFSDSDRWLACTSDKGTAHIFDLRPTPEDQTQRLPTSTSGTSQRPIQPHRKTASHPPSAIPPSQPHRLSTGAPSSNISGHSTPSTAHQGSIQEYYGLLPVPKPLSPSSQPVINTTLNAFKTSPWAPKVLKDARSVASAQFIVGEDGPYWQVSGGVSHRWTTAPDGTRRRVRSKVPALPADPTGRPAKGIIAFAPVEKVDEDVADGGGVVLYVVGGGTDARWECFDLLPKEGGGWALVRRGWRGYLARQFV